MLFYRCLGFLSRRHRRERCGILIVLDSVVVVVRIHDIFDAVVIGVLSRGDDIGRFPGRWRGMEGVSIRRIEDAIVVVVRIDAVRDSVTVIIPGCGGSKGWGGQVTRGYR